MSERKLRTFAEKINRFLQKHENGSWRFRQKTYFLEHYPYLPENEIDELLRLCRQIETTAHDLANQVVWEKTLTQEDMRALLVTQYPDLEAIRIDRLMARSLYGAVA